MLQKEEKKKYDVWFPSWERSLTSEERKLLKFMNRQRVAEVHSEGAETTAELEYIPIAPTLRATPFHATIHRAACSLFHN